MTKHMNSLELFAGAGGLGIGLHEAHFHPLQVVEWDQYCCDTIRENKQRGLQAVSGWNIVQGDVRLVDFRKFEGKVSLVSGGPPCQPFSIGGRHKAYDDRRDMFPQAIRAIRETRPDAFILENVKGLTRQTFQNYLQYIVLQLHYPEIVRRSAEDWPDHLRRLEQHHTSNSNAGLQYRVVWQVLNAANFGIPQKRERVFFVGFRSDTEIQWGFPQETHSHDALLWQMVHGDYWDRHEVAKSDRMTVDISKVSKEKHGALKPWKTVRDALSGLPDPEKKPDSCINFLNHRFQAGARSYPGHTGSYIDLPAKTLKAGVHGVPGGENMLLKPDGSVRYFTVRESARLQTFPDEFLFHGSWTETMRQLGNAVPVQLAATVGNDVAKHLRNRHVRALQPTG